MTVKPWQSWHHFDSAEDAIEYRREHGTGGWIFEISDNGEAVLFPWQSTPKDIFNSVFVHGRIGRFIGTDERKTWSYDMAEKLGL